MSLVGYEDKLREASALGDMDAIKLIAKSGKVNINHQHKMNGWTALHWAAKRNHSLAVAFLLMSGADDSLTDANGALAGDVTNDPEIRKMLKNTEDTQSLQPASSSLQFTPNYIKSPIIHKDEYYAVADEAMGRHERQRQLDDAAVRHKHFQDVSTSPQAAVTNSVTTSCQTPPLVRKELSSEVLSAAGTHSKKGGGLTKILKLKVEGERDFIEADLPFEELNMNSLLSLVTSELRINQSFIKYLRKLPDTKLRRDIDVMRLNNYQEIEVVLLN